MEDQGITLFRIVISFAAGILSFLSPCVLPLVPGYISLISGVTGGDERVHQVAPARLYHQQPLTASGRSRGRKWPARQRRDGR